MTKRGRKKNIIALIISSPILFFFVILVIFIAISFPIARNISKKYKVDQEILELEKEIIRLESSNSEFKKMIKYFESDSFVEEQARLNFGLKKRGEEVVVVNQVEIEIDLEPDKSIEGVKDRNSNVISWFDYFFK